MPRAPGNRREDRRGNRQDQRTGAGHDHQRHRPVKGRTDFRGVVESGQAEQQPPAKKHHQRAAEHRVGVTRAKPVGEALARRPQFLRAADQADDFLQGALRRQPGHPVVHRPPEIQRAAEHPFTRVFFHRHRLAGQRRLVARTASRQDFPVGRVGLARFHPHGVAHVELVHVHLNLFPLGSKPDRLFRCRTEQCAHLTVRAVQRKCFHRARRGEQKQQQHRLTPGADRHRARGHGEHEEMDVELQGAKIRPGILGRIPAARRDAHDIKPLRQPRQAGAKGFHRIAAEPGNTADARQPRQFLPFRTAIGWLRHDRRPLQFPPVPEALGGHAGVPAQLGRAVPFPQAETRRGSRGMAAGRLGLHGGNGRGQPHLELVQVHGADGCNLHLPGHGIDPHRADCRLVPQKGRQLTDPVVRFAGGNFVHPLQRVRQSAFGKFNCPAAPARLPCRPA